MVLPVSTPHEQDLLVPAFASSERHSPTAVAVFNLIATIIGGGVLSLPLAFQKLGVGWATLLMIVAAAVTDRSLYLLCLSARLTGTTSYGEVGRVAVAPWMETMMAVLLCVFLLFVLVAYMVLLRDIFTPLAGLLLFSGKDPPGNLVLLVLLLVLAPFLVQHNLHALRYNCYVGFCSVSLLCLAICHHGFFGSLPTNYGGDNMLTSTTTNLSDALFAFPIIMLSFLCHFNILPIQAALVQPTRARMQNVIHAAVFCCCTLMYLFGLGGFAYAGIQTQGNILLNIAHRNDDWMLVLGRVGVGINICVATPMMLLPCRENLLEVVEIVMGKEDQLDVTVIGEQTALLRDEPIQKDPVFYNPLVHYGSTLLIVVLCYVGAYLADSVAVVWSLCGSSMAFLIAFILPAVYYLRIQQREHVPNNRSWVVFCWILLPMACLSAVACTVQTVMRVVFPE